MVDGFRCIAFRDGSDVVMQSKSGQPLERYFPEIVEALRGLRAKRFVLDGEIFIESDGVLDFDALLQRIHPAASRIRKLAIETPAHYALFDLLVDGRGKAVYELPLLERRNALEAFAADGLERGSRIALSPATPDYDEAKRWFEGGMAQFDGVIAKRRDASYRFGERDAVVKVKRVYTADCVVGGFRLAKDNKTVASLLLGLYDKNGALDYVGFTSGFTANEKRSLYEKLAAIKAECSFTGRTPGGPSRWNRGKESGWTPVEPQLVLEVQFDHVTNGRFRHGTRPLRFRPDKSPRQCTTEQLA